MLVEIDPNKYRYICNMFKIIINICEIEYEGILPEFYSGTLFASICHMKTWLTIICLWLFLTLFREILRYTYSLINFRRINTRILQEIALQIVKWVQGFDCFYFNCFFLLLYFYLINVLFQQYLMITKLIYGMKCLFHKLLHVYIENFSWKNSNKYCK